MFSNKKPYAYWFKSKWTSVFPFKVSRDKFNRSYNNFDDPFGRINVPNETEDVNKILFDIITKKNDSKRYITKHISSDFKYKLYCIKYNSNRGWNKEKCHFKCKKQ